MFLTASQISMRLSIMKYGCKKAWLNAQHLQHPGNKVLKLSSLKSHHPHITFLSPMQYPACQSGMSSLLSPCLLGRDCEIGAKQNGFTVTWPFLQPAGAYIF